MLVARTDTRIPELGDNSDDDSLPDPNDDDGATHTNGLTKVLAAAGMTKVAGVNRDDSSGHGSQPWRSAVRKTDARGDFELPPKHHASWAGAVHRILKAYRDNDVRDANGRFLLAPGQTVDAAQLASLVDAARQQAADDSSRCLTGGALEPPATGGALRDWRFIAPGAGAGTPSAQP